MEISIPPKPKAPSYYSISEAAKRWGVTPNVLYSEIRAGRLKAVIRTGCKRGLRVNDQIPRSRVRFPHGAPLKIQGQESFFSP